MEPETQKPNYQNKTGKTITKENTDLTSVESFCCLKLNQLKCLCLTANNLLFLKCGADLICSDLIGHKEPREKAKTQHFID